MGSYLITLARFLGQILEPVLWYYGQLIPKYSYCSTLLCAQVFSDIWALEIFLTQGRGGWNHFRIEYDRRSDDATVGHRINALQNAYHHNERIPNAFQAAEYRGLSEPEKLLQLQWQNGGSRVCGHCWMTSILLPSTRWPHMLKPPSKVLCFSPLAQGKL